MRERILSYAPRGAQPTRYSLDELHLGSWRIALRSCLERGRYIWLIEVYHAGMYVRLTPRQIHGAAVNDDNTAVRGDRFWFYTGNEPTAQVLLAALRGAAANCREAT